VAVVQVPPEPPRDEIEPLDAKLSRLHITVDDELLQLLEAAKDAFSHSFPSGRAAEVIKHGLRVALAQHDKRLGLVEKPLKAPRPSRTNHIPAHVKREVLRRAGGRRCEWILPSGERCDCRRKLEFDHLKALALGGKSTLENVRLLCRSHNLLAARQVFGDALMDRYAPGRSPARR
jgi:5-methylcytosine-specific restriction endonuclease McrA